jgi:IclR family transcriptional regulator, acetate operon repressor
MYSPWARPKAELAACEKNGLPDTERGVRKSPTVSVPAPAAEKRKARVQSAARAVDLLQAVARGDSGGLSAKDLSVQLGLPRQVVYHLIHTLLASSMLRRAEGKNYVLGWGVATLVQGYRRQTGAPDYLARYAEQAAARTGETAYVVGLVDGEIVVLATARSTSSIHAAEPAPGTAGDAHARASGKLLLAMIPVEESRAYLSRRPLTARTENTITDLTKIEAELARIRKDWVAVEREEYSTGLACLAVPVGTPPGMLALGISAPVERFKRNVNSYIPTLRDIAQLQT